MTFLELCQQRSSVRSYSDQPVEQAKLDYILECVRIAPSAVNYQPWKFYLLRTEEQCERVRACYARAWFATAPVYLLACRDKGVEWVRGYDAKPHGDIDVAIAVEHICLAATEQGLGTCWVCHFDPIQVHSAFGLPENLEPVAIVSLGYDASEGSAKRKVRKCMDEIVEELE